MAVRREVIEHYTDDLDGSKADEEIKFSIDGRAYVIDLSKKNAAAFRKAFDVYVAAARRDQRAPAARTRSASATSSTGIDMTDLREWAAKNGHKVAARGRVAKDIVDKYLASK